MRIRPLVSSGRSKKQRGGGAARLQVYDSEYAVIPCPDEKARQANPNKILKDGPGMKSCRCYRCERLRLELEKMGGQGAAP